MNLTQTELAYAAGVVDGEGCIKVVKAKATFRIVVEVSTCDRELAEWFKERFGGGILCDEAWIGNVRTKDKHVWYLSAMESVIWFLELIEPYLVIKRRKRRARLLIERWPREKATGLTQKERDKLRTKRRKVRDQVLAVK